MNEQLDQLYAELHSEGKEELEESTSSGSECGHCTDCKPLTSAQKGIERKVRIRINEQVKLAFAYGPLPY